MIATQSLHPKPARSGASLLTELAVKELDHITHTLRAVDLVPSILVRLPCDIYRAQRLQVLKQHLSTLSRHEVVVLQA